MSIFIAFLGFATVLAGCSAMIWALVNYEDPKMDKPKAFAAKLLNNFRR